MCWDAKLAACLTPAIIMCLEALWSWASFGLITRRSPPEPLEPACMLCMANGHVVTESLREGAAHANGRVYVIKLGLYSEARVAACPAEMYRIYETWTDGRPLTEKSSDRPPCQSSRSGSKALWAPLGGQHSQSTTTVWTSRSPSAQTHLSLLLL